MVVCGVVGSGNAQHVFAPNCRGSEQRQHQQHRIHRRTDEHGPIRLHRLVHKVPNRNDGEVNIPSHNGGHDGDTRVETSSIRFEKSMTPPAPGTHCRCPPVPFLGGWVGGWVGVYVGGWVGACALQHVSITHNNNNNTGDTQALAPPLVHDEKDDAVCVSRGIGRGRRGGLLVLLSAHLRSRDNLFGKRGFIHTVTQPFTIDACGQSAKHEY